MTIDDVSGILACFERFGAQYGLTVAYSDDTGYVYVGNDSGVKASFFLEFFIGWNNSLEGLEIIRGLMYRLSRQSWGANNGNDVLVRKD